MEDLTEKTFEQRLEGREGVRSHEIIWRTSLKKQGKSKCKGSECGLNSKETSAPGAKDRGMFKRGTQRGNIQIDTYESLSVEGNPVSFCRSQSA